MRESSLIRISATSLSDTRSLLRESRSLLWFRSDSLSVVRAALLLAAALFAGLAFDIQIAINMTSVIKKPVLLMSVVD